MVIGTDVRDGKDAASTTEELELELEALDIADEPLELEGPDEAENEELAKKLLDEQGKNDYLSLKQRFGYSLYQCLLIQDTSAVSTTFAWCPKSVFFILLVLCPV